MIKINLNPINPTIDRILSVSLLTCIDEVQLKISNDINKEFYVINIGFDIFDIIYGEQEIVLNQSNIRQDKINMLPFIDYFYNKIYNIPKRTEYSYKWCINKFIENSDILGAINFTNELFDGIVLGNSELNLRKTYEKHNLSNSTRG